jgi:hypothetical protein
MARPRWLSSFVARAALRPQLRRDDKSEVAARGGRSARKFAKAFIVRFRCQSNSLRPSNSRREAMRNGPLSSVILKRAAAGVIQRRPQDDEYRSIPATSQ